MSKTYNFTVFYKSLFGTNTINILYSITQSKEMF